MHMRKYLLPSPDVRRSTITAQKTGSRKESRRKRGVSGQPEESRGIRNFAEKRSNCDRRVGGTIQFGTDRRRVSGAMRRRVAAPLMRDRGERAGSRLRAQSDNAETGEASTLGPRLSALDSRQGKARQGKARVLVISAAGVGRLETALGPLVGQEIAPRGEPLLD